MGGTTAAFGARSFGGSWALSSDNCGRVPVMLLGLVHINMGSMSQPHHLVAAARTAEGAGFDSVWAGEHIVLPDPQVPPSPMSPQDPALESLLALTWAAAHTTTIRLATGIVILPQRNPVVLAKQVATLDVLSGGRVTLGVGVGYLEPEFRALGANFAERGVVTDEYLDAMRTLWYDEHPEFHGRFADFAGIDAYPRPLQEPIPLVVAGHSPPAYRRAVARAHGWYGYWLTPDDVAQALASLRAAAARVERPVELGELEISVTPRGRITPEQAAGFAEVGVHRLVPRSPPTPDGPAQTVEAAVAAIAGL
jgi:probable F420-dependent oxidoreductase